MENETQPEGVVVYRIIRQRELPGLSRQRFADRAAGGDTAPGAVTW